MSNATNSFHSNQTMIRGKMWCNDNKLSTNEWMNERKEGEWNCEIF